MEVSTQLQTGGSRIGVAGASPDTGEAKLF